MKLFQNCFICTILVHIKLPHLGSGDGIFSRGYHHTMSLFEPIANHIKTRSQQLSRYPTQWLVWVAPLHVLRNLDNIGNWQTIIVVDHCFTTLFD